MTESYCLYFPDEGKYSEGMTLKEAREMAKTFLEAYIVDMLTGEVLN